MRPIFSNSGSITLRGRLSLAPWRASSGAASGVRRNDALTRLDGYTFALGTAPCHNMHLRSALQLATRLQALMRAPVQTATAGSVRLSASVGFCLSSRLPGASGEPLLHAASVALV